MCNLYRSMLARMGATVTTFGDSAEELTGLSDPTYKGPIPQT